MLPNIEQTETGKIQTSQGIRNYRIRLLPVTSFPDLPRSIADELISLHCMVPQTFEARRPENVIHGAFEQKGSQDWAVLCSHDGSTDLLVFFQDAVAKPTTLSTHKDTDRMGAENSSSVMGSAWGITTIPQGELAHTPAVQKQGPFDHDGIEDDFVERLSVVRYHRNGSWLTLERND